MGVCGDVGGLVFPQFLPLGGVPLWPVGTKGVSLTIVLSELTPLRNKCPGTSELSIAIEGVGVGGPS